MARKVVLDATLNEVPTPDAPPVSDADVDRLLTWGTGDPAVGWTHTPPLDPGWYWWTGPRRYVRPLRVFTSQGILFVEYVGQDRPLTMFATPDMWWAGPFTRPEPPGEE